MADESPTSGEGPRQLYRPGRELLASFAAGGGPGGSVKFKVKTPDPRLRVRVSVFGIAESGAVTPQTMLAGRLLTLWLSALIDDPVAGGPGLPVNDLAGSTEAAPIAIPSSAGLAGFSREFSTIADAIQGVVTIPVQGAGSAGRLYVEAAFAPQVQQVIPWKQWEEIRSGCGIVTLEGPIST